MRCYKHKGLERLGVQMIWDKYVGWVCPICVRQGIGSDKEDYRKRYGLSK